MAIKPRGKKVTGTKKADKITWVSQKPWKKNLTVKAGSGNDVVNFKKSKYKNVIYGEKGNDKIYGGKNVDKIYGGVGNDKLYGYNGNDIIKAGSGKDYVDGGAGNDKIYGESGTNNLKGGAGNDSIWAGSGVDNIYGGTGNDFIYAGNGTNNIRGEAGDDVIYASKGINNVYINKGEGNDKIRGVETSSKLNLNLGTGLQRVVVYQQGANYVVERKYSETYSEFTTLENFNYDAAKNKVSVIYNGKTVALSSLYIPNYDPATSVIKTLSEDGENYDAPNSKNQIVYGGAGNDTITTREGNDYISAGDGDNGITISGGDNTVITGDGDDTISVADNGTNYIEAGTGNNRIVTTGNSTVTAGAGNDTITLDGTGSQSNINAGDGANSITISSSGASIIRAGAGNDTITVSAGTNDINLGTGNDRISITGGTNTVDMSGVTGGYLDISGGNNTVNGGAGNHTYNLAGGNTELTIGDHEGWSGYTLSGGQNTVYGNNDAVDVVTISSGTGHEVYTGFGDDTISITGGSNSYVDTGADADRVTISSGASNTTVNAGKGNDSIVAYGSGNILYGGQGQDTISASNANGNSTIYGGNDSLGTDTGYNEIFASNGYNNVIYAGNGVDTVDGEGNPYIKGDSIWAGYEGSGNNTIYGGNGNDYIQADDSNDASITGGEGNDTIYSGSSSSTVDGGKGNDTIYIYSSSYGSIRGGDGDDYISSPYGSGASGTADIWGDKGSDSISVSYGSYSANIHFKKGDGSDTIDGGYGKTEAHTLVFDDVNKDDIFTNVSTSGDLTITYNNGKDSIYVEHYAGWNSDTQDNSVAYIKTADMEYSMNLKDFINTHSTHQMTDEEAANNYYGTYFNDNITGTSGEDSIYGRYGDDTLTGGAGNDSLYGESGDDSLVGGAGNDYFSDYNGDNTMVGGTGNDSLYGYSSDGTNTMLFYQGDGVDTIDSGSSWNKLLFDVNSLNDIEIIYDTENEEVALKYSDTDRVVLKDYYNNEDYHDEYNVNIGKISEPNTTHSLQWLMDQRHIIMPSEQYNNTVSGGSSSDHIYIADSWCNTIEGGSGDDTITLLGEINEDGNYDDIGYVDYVFDSYGDGKDVLENTKSYYSSSIVFKYVGNNKDDVVHQKEFLESLVFTKNDNGDLIITYGNNNSTITIKGYNPEDPQTSINYFEFAYYNGETGKYDIRSDSYSFSEYMHIDRNAGGTETSIQGANYNELIYGSNGDDTINPGQGNNLIKPKDGADTIEITKLYNDEDELQYSENTLYMGTDDVSDTIWLKDVTDPENELHIYETNGDLIIDVKTKIFDENDYYGYHYQTYSRVRLKDYFSYIELDDDEPTYMNIKIGNGDSIVNTTIRDLYYYGIDNNIDDPETYINGTLLRDNIWTSPDVAEVVRTGAGNDSIYASSSYNSLADTVYAGAGDDHIEYRAYSSSDPDVVIYGEDGNDHIELSEGTACGGTGNDSIKIYSYTKEGVDTGATIYGGTGTDSLDSELDEDTLEGGYGNDYIYGSKGKDSIKGDGGNDKIYAGAGNDTVIGDRGADTIYGGDGADLIYSSNTIVGAEGYSDGNGSEVHGGAGKDTIYVSDRDTNIWGDEGDDVIISAYNSSATYHLKNTDGNDTIIGPSRGSGEGKIVLEDIVFGGGEGNYIHADFDKENNRFTLYYNSTGTGNNITYQNHFTIEHFLKEQGGDYVYDENGDYTYDQYGFYVTEGAHTEIDWYDDLYTGITTIEDKNGKSYNIFSLIDMEEVEDATPSDTTIFSDRLIAAEGGNTFNMKSGDDVFFSSEGAYTYYVNGNEGNDSLYGSTANDRFWGDEGDDWLEGGGGANYLWGGEGNDTLESGYGKTPSDSADTLIGGAGANVYQMTFVSPNTGNIIPAIIQSTSADDTIYLRSIESSSNIDDFYRAGNDLLLRYHVGSTTGVTNSITIKDWFSNPLNLDVAFYNSSTHGMGSKYKLMNLIQSKYSGSDIKFLSGNVTITSSNQSTYAAETLFASDSANTITFDASYNGDPKTVYGLGGNDVIDISTNSMGSSTVYGGDGNDTITAHGCTHTGFFDGGDGNDSITGGAGNDTIFGGAGADTIDANTGYGHIIFTGERARYDGQFVSDMDSILNYANANSWDSHFTQLEEAGDITNYVTCANGRTSAGDENKIYSIGENSSITLMNGNNDIHVSLANNSKISDVNTAGTNTLKLHDLGPSSSNAAIFMNVKKNGTVDGDIYIAGIYDMDYHWLDNGGEFDDDIGGVVTIAKTTNVTAANVFSTITNYYGGRYLTKANVNSFIEQVASWLSNANDGAGYADVKTALASDEAESLKNLFWGMNYYSNPEQCVWQQNS